MDKPTKEQQFHSDSDFRKDLIKIFTQTLKEKLPNFIEYCIYTSNLAPVMETYYIMTINTFENTTSDKTDK